MGGFQVQSQPWLLVDQTSASLLDGSNAGIMGLAFDTIANTGAVPFWQTLAQGGQLSTPEMSFWFTRFLGDTSAQEEEFGGIFTLGGQNQTLFTGDIEFLPLVTNAGRQTYWLLSVSGTYPSPLSPQLFPTRISIAGITVNGQTVTLPSGNLAAIDTGTTLIGGPSAAVSAIYAQIPGSQPLSGNLAGFYGFRMFLSLLVNPNLNIMNYAFSLACDTTVSVTMAFGGKAWPIDAQDMNLGRASATSDICAGGIFDLSAGSSIGEGGGNPNWVVGATFLKNVYSVFRSQPAAIGFAELSNAAGGSSGERCNLASSFYREICAL